MIATIFKRVEVFQPYNVPIQPLIISPNEEKNSNDDSQVLNSTIEKTSNYGDDIHQLDTTSCSGENSKTPEKTPMPSSFKTFKCLLSKKRRNSNLVKCFKCQIEDCEALFETEEELQEHKKKHETIFKCTFENCNSQFMSEKNLQKHLKTHCTLVKKYLCPFPGCGKRFTALYNQKIHYRIHTGERPYKCNICGNDYYDRANYKYHVKTAHKICDKNEIICSHGGFCHEFKTKKQKVMHHNKLEKECRAEKNYLIRLINKFETSLKDLKKSDKSISLDEMEEFQNVQIQRKKTEKVISDKDLFESVFSVKNN